MCVLVVVCLSVCVCAPKSSVFFKLFCAHALAHACWRVDNRPFVWREEAGGRSEYFRSFAVHQFRIKCNRSASRTMHVNKFSFQALAKFMNPSRVNLCTIAATNQQQSGGHSDGGGGRSWRRRHITLIREISFPSFFFFCICAPYKIIKYIIV